MIQGYLDALKRLLSPEYLVVADPGPLGSLWVLYLSLGLLFAVGLAAALWVLLGPGEASRSTAPKAWAWFELWVCLAGLATVAGRFQGWPGWSARIWPYTLALLAVAGALAYHFRRLRLPPWLLAQLRILALSPATDPQPSEPPSPYTSWLTPWFVLGLLAHLAGIGLVVTRRFHLPLWTSPLILLVLLLPQAPLLLRRRPPCLMALTPLLGAYTVTALWLLYRRLDITIIGWQGLAFPNPMLSLFYVDGIILASIAYTALCQLSVTSNVLAQPRLLWRWAVTGLLALTLAWAGVVYFGKRTHGATASDPFAYAQMGVDLAERGSFLHRYSLFEQVMPLDIAWAPLQPVGYHIPRNEQGDCPSVWATGASVLLAAGYALLGETGLYVTTPFVALLAMAATWTLVQEALRAGPKPVRHVTAALTVTLLATSTEHVDRLLVPMADAPSQLFTVMTLLFALRGMHHLEEGRAGIWPFLLSGISFAWAYWVRHTQLVLALPLILAVLLGSRAATPRPARKPSHSNGGAQTSVRRPPSIARRRWSLVITSLAAFFGAAFITALPDIIYRWRVFGGPFATETTELPLMGLQHIAPVAWQMTREALAAGEWGYLFPLAIYGSYRLLRAHGRETVVLGSGFLAVLLVHLSYRALRLRDLISIFPLLDLAVAYGAVILVHRVRWMPRAASGTARLGRALLPAAVVAWVVLSLALSRWAMLDNLWKPGWASFGYVRAEQRAAFNRLAELTPPEGIIAASLNAGAIMMYTGRDAIRPYDSWTRAEWSLFLRAMQEQGRPIFLLDDGGLMAEFIEQERAHHQLTPLEALEVPMFYTRDQETGTLYRLEWGP